MVVGEQTERFMGLSYSKFCSFCFSPSVHLFSVASPIMPLGVFPSFPQRTINTGLHIQETFCGGLMQLDWAVMS